MKLFALLPVLTTLSLAAQAAPIPGNTASGKKLYDANCTTCHTDSVYLRKDRQVNNLDGLNQQISACGHMTNITLGKTQVNDLVKYLNETYYKFK